MKIIAELARAFVEYGKKPLLQRFSQYLDAATKQGRLACTDAPLAASQFLRMIQESLLWPKVMGTGRPTPNRTKVINGAIEVFLSAYSPDSRHSPEGVAVPRCYARLESAAPAVVDCMKQLRLCMLPRTYEDQVCSLARSLEIIGDRWPLLIVRDALRGVPFPILFCRGFE